MPTPQEEQLNANIELLLSIPFEGMDRVARQNLMDAMEDIRKGYGEATEKGKADKKYKDVGDAIANSLPGIVKGALSAAEAFKKGDYISGSAALMDICSSIMPVLSSLMSAAGPEGALLGALFSVVGQILSFFAPKQPSLEDKIQKMLDHMQSEKEIQDEKAVAMAIASYTKALRTKCLGEHTMEAAVALAGSVSLTAGSTAVTGTGTDFKQAAAGDWLTFGDDSAPTPYKIEAIASATSLTLALAYKGASGTTTSIKRFHRTLKQPGIAEILAMPLKTEDDADNFFIQVRALELGLMRDQQKLDVPVFANWNVAAYLTRPENQRKEGWPEVLGVWSQTYADLLGANVMLMCLADPTTLQRRKTETQPSNTHSHLSPETRATCHLAILELESLAHMLHNAWKSDKQVMLELMPKLRPAALERGLYAHIGFKMNGQVLIIGPGNGTRSDIGWDYKKNAGWMGSISIHVPSSQHDSFTPIYELLASETYPNAIARYTLNAITGELYGHNSQIEPRQSRGDFFNDVAAIPIHGQAGFDNQVTLSVIAISDVRTQHDDYVNFYTFDKDNQATRINTEPHVGYGTIIRCLTLPPGSAGDDPDAGALADATANPAGPTLHAATPSLIYGGARDTNRLWVMLGVVGTDVALPDNWPSYNGIAVDPYYLWVFGKSGIACATHASVIKVRQGKLARPSWIYHEFDKALDKPEVCSLSVCADGTLFAALGDQMYTAEFDITRASNRIVTKSWLNRGGAAAQVIKMPIPCWPVFSSLNLHLQAN